MAQFRTTADIITEILQKAGEGYSNQANSQYQSIALTYANKVHHAIIGGGSILNMNVDEPWVWARAHAPITIELQTAFTVGTLTTLFGSQTVSFSTAPTVSLEGYHIQALGRDTVYKITQHTASSTVAILDSSFVDTIASASFRAFKLDYPIFPAYMVVDNTNDQLDFAEVGTATVVKKCSLNHGAYLPANLATHVATQMNSAGTGSYTGSFDTVANTFAITAAASSFSFKLLGASGANVRRTALQLLGFDMLDASGASVYASTYMPNQISRMIEPFRVDRPNFAGEHMVYSTDPVRMQQDYPLNQVNERIPDRFARISEDNNGVIWVRFNAYPRNVTKLQVDYIPQPVDLQNNTASQIRLPRQDVDTLIHGAAAFILWDKNDNKWQAMMQLCSGQLDAMKKKNHDMLLRTGQEFAQIVPRQDLNRMVRGANYGYTINGGR